MGHLHSGFGTEAEVCYWVSSRISLSCSTPPQKKISKKQRRLGKWLEVAVSKFPEATLEPTPRGLHRHTQRGSRCGWSLACSGLAQVPAPPAAVWIPRGPRPSGHGLPDPAARCRTGPPPLLLFSLGEDAFSCCFRTRVRSKSTGGGVRALGWRERRFSRRGHKTRSENRGGNYPFLLCTRRPGARPTCVAAHLHSSERAHE